MYTEHIILLLLTKLAQILDLQYFNMKNRQNVNKANTHCKYKQTHNQSQHAANAISKNKKKGTFAVFSDNHRLSWVSDGGTS